MKTLNVSVEQKKLSFKEIFRQENYGLFQLFETVFNSEVPLRARHDKVISDYGSLARMARN